MIKITYKCKVLPLKLDCVFWNSLILTNLKRDSLLQYFLTHFSNNMTSIWQEAMRNWKYWQESSSSTRDGDGRGEDGDAWGGRWSWALNDIHYNLCMQKPQRLPQQNTKTSMFEQDSGSILSLTVCFGLCGRSNGSIKGQFTQMKLYYESCLALVLCGQEQRPSYSG